MPPTDEVAKNILLVLTEYVMVSLYHTCVYVSNSGLGIRPF